MMNDKAQNTIAHYGMLRQGDRVVVGVSGGADSVALLVFLCALREEMGLKIVACHLNHCLRGQESERDEQFVVGLCSDLGVELVTKRADINALATTAHRSVEETAREQRYVFFDEVAGQGDKIATAHTANDNRETLLLNLTRGTGLRGLCGIPPMRGNIIRPLIACSRDDTEKFCKQNGFSWVEDSTNREMKYTRNILRHKVLPLLEGLNPALSDNLTEQCGRLRRDADFLDDLATARMQRLSRPDGTLERDGFLKLPLPLSERILVRMISQGGSPSARMVGLCKAKAEQGSGRQQLCGGWDFFATRDVIGVECRTAQVEPEMLCEELVPPELGQSVQLVMGNRKILVSTLSNNLDNSQNIYNYPLKNVLRYDTIYRNVKIRSCHMGDKLRIPGRGVSKTLKKLFQEGGIPPNVRRQTLVLTDGDDHILWVEGFGVDESAMPTADTRTVMVIQPDTKE